MNTDELRDMSREAAERRSRDCTVCQGAGMATLYRDGYRGLAVEILHDAERGRHQVVMRIMAHCACTLGQWMRFRTDDEMRRRIPDLHVIGEGRYPWSLEDPSLNAMARFHSPSQWREALRRMRGGIGQPVEQGVVQESP